MTVADPVRIAALVEEFEVESPAQQLVDRLLIGYREAGMFQRLQAVSVTIHTAPGVGDKEIERRAKDHGLKRAGGIPALVAESTAVVVVPKGVGH